MIYPDYILGILRQRARLDKDDDSQDARFEAYEPRKALREVCAWKLGSAVWATQFEEWAEDCGLTLTEVSAAA